MSVETVLRQIERPDADKLADAWRGHEQGLKADLNGIRTDIKVLSEKVQTGLSKANTALAVALTAIGLTGAMWIHLTGETDDIERAVAENGLQIGLVRADLGRVQDDVASVRNDVASVQTDLSAVQAEMSTVRSELSSVQNELALLRSVLIERLDRIEGNQSSDTNDRAEAEGSP